MSIATAPATAPPLPPSGGGNSNPADRQPEATVHIGGLGDAPPPTEALLTELCTQVAPVKHVYLPRDRITGGHHGYAFCEFYTAEDAAYAARVLNLVRLSGRPIRVSATGQAARPAMALAGLAVVATAAAAAAARCSLSATSTQRWTRRRSATRSAALAASST